VKKAKITKRASQPVELLVSVPVDLSCTVHPTVYPTGQIDQSDYDNVRKLLEEVQSILKKGTVNGRKAVSLTFAIGYDDGRIYCQTAGRIDPCRLRGVLDMYTHADAWNFRERVLQMQLAGGSGQDPLTRRNLEEGM
jgi:hypothetical protein